MTATVTPGSQTNSTSGTPPTVVSQAPVMGQMTGFSAVSPTNQVVPGNSQFAKPAALTEYDVQRLALKKRKLDVVYWSFVAWKRRVNIGILGFG